MRRERWGRRVQIAQPPGLQLTHLTLWRTAAARSDRQLPELLAVAGPAARGGGVQAVFGGAEAATLPPPGAGVIVAGPPAGAHSLPTTTHHYSTPCAQVGPDADRMCTPAAQMLSPPVPGGSPPPAPRKPKYRRKPQVRQLFICRAVQAEGVAGQCRPVTGPAQTALLSSGQLPS